MKIVFIGGRDIRILGGIESYMYNLGTQLVKLGHEPIVYCESNRDETEWVNGFKVIHQKSIKSNFICKPWLGLKATIKTILHEKNVSIIHYNAWPPSLWCWMPGIFGIKTLMQGHGLEWQRSKYSPKQQKIMKFMEKVTAYLNQNLIMCSEVQTKYFKKIYSREATTIPTAVNMPAIKVVDESAVLEKFDLLPQRYFLFIARLVQDKNPDYLIKGFKAAEHNGMKLVIAGSNDANKEYVDYLHKLADGDKDIVFTGAVYGDEKDAILRNAFAFCLPSTIEGLAIGLLEAMSYKLPIMASNIEANQEVLNDNEAVWIRPEQTGDIKEAIEYCIANPEKLQAYKEVNYKKVFENYTWEKVTQKYLYYLKSIGVK